MLRLVNLVIHLSHSVALLILKVAHVDPQVFKLDNHLLHGQGFGMSIELRTTRLVALFNAQFETVLLVQYGVLCSKFLSQPLRNHIVAIWFIWSVISSLFIIGAWVL